jgi:hypothetical protein
MDFNLYCASCGRKEGSGSDDVKPVLYLDQMWCTSCAAIRYTAGGSAYVEQPSPGQMWHGPISDSLAAWEDCFLKTPKKRIIKEKAKAEIQKAWENWDGDKSREVNMMVFFNWLRKFRPYFLTFRCSGDPWQTIQCWLIQYEREKNK